MRDLERPATGRRAPGVPRASSGPPARVDADSRRWLERLQVGHPRHHQAVACLHDVLRRVALFELSRRRHHLRSVSGPEFEDLAQQAADDALVSVLDRLDDFEGRSRFTTWAYKFAVFEVSAKVARHAWRRQAPDVEGILWDNLPDPITVAPEEWVEQRGQLDALWRAIGDLTRRQREVFVAVAVHGVPIDVVALELGSNRNAVYKNLFDAKRRLREKMAAAGHPVSDARDAAPRCDGGRGRSAPGWSR
jgi:RNA polymerase sigma-70 factor, ECF subfamily